MNAVGIKDYATVIGTTAATSALQGVLSMTNAATQAVGTSIIPPGTEGASILAQLKQVSNTTDFSAKLEAGIIELQRRNAVMGAAYAQTAAVDAAGAVGISGIDTSIVA